jgi:hypothetical protein
MEEEDMHNILSAYGKELLSLFAAGESDPWMMFIVRFCINYFKPCFHSLLDLLSNVS